MRACAYLLAAVGCATSSPALSSEPAGCEFEYRATAGDTFQDIAKVAYGASGPQLILARNQHLSSKLGALAEGARVIVPCIDGDGGFIPDAEALSLSMAKGGVRAYLAASAAAPVAYGPPAPPLKPAIGDDEAVAQLIPTDGGAIVGADTIQAASIIDRKQPRFIYLPENENAAAETVADSPAIEIKEAADPEPRIEEAVEPPSVEPTAEEPEVDTATKETEDASQEVGNAEFAISAESEDGFLDGYTATPRATPEDEKPVEDVAAEGGLGDESESLADGDAETPAVGEASPTEAAPSVGTVDDGDVAQKPAPEAEDETQATAANAPTAPTPEEPKAVRLLTANGFAPFADENLEGGGLALEIARRVLAGPDDLRRIEAVFVDDREAHLSDLLVNGSFELGLPWMKPRCEEIEKLREIAPIDARVCEEFLFSEPIYEFVNGFFMLRETARTARSSFSAFADTRICRPAGASMLDLAIEGLTEETATFVRPPTMADCIALLRDGEVDAVSGEAAVAESAMAQLDLLETVVELPDLSILQSVHAIAARDRPGGAASIKAFDEGLHEMKITGEWFEIVGKRLSLL